MAVQVFIGFLLLSLTYLIVKAARMELLTAILGKLMEVGMLAVIILFQREIRRSLLWIGGTTTLRGSELLGRLLGSKRTNKPEGAPDCRSSQGLGREQHRGTDCAF